MTNKYPLNGRLVPDCDHVTRYIAPRHIDNGVINGSGFLRRPGEEASSVNWLEHFDPPLERQINSVRAHARIKYAKTGALVRINVGETRIYVMENSPDRLKMDIVHDPLLAEGDFLADQSHALIKGLPAANSPEADLVNDLIANCILQPIFPAVIPK